MTQKTTLSPMALPGRTYNFVAKDEAITNAINVTETSVLFARSNKTLVFEVSEKTVSFPRGRKSVQFEGDS